MEIIKYYDKENRFKKIISQSNTVNLSELIDMINEIF